MISVAEIVERIEKVDMLGLISVHPDAEGRNFAEVQMWRLGGAFQNDRERIITMFIDPARDDLDNELFFFVPPLEECDPNDIALTIFMDANAQVFHGGHSWQPGENKVVFYYAMPIPTDVTDFPDTALFARLLKDMYKGLLFRELKQFKMRIDEDLMLSPEERDTKRKKADDMVGRLVGPREEDCEGV